VDQPNDRFDSWKAIAEYLGRDRTTVMRWERTAGLPVRRIQGGRGRSVFAYKTELDRWLSGDLGQAVREQPDERPEPVDDAQTTRQQTLRPRLRTGRTAAAGLFLALTAAWLWWWWPPPAIVEATIAGSDIVATDAAGREIWRHRLARGDGRVVATRLLVADLDADARPEVLALLHHTKASGEAYGTLAALGDDGRARWERMLEDRYRFGADEFAPAWFPSDVVVYRSGGATRIAVAQHHRTWWPSVVVTYDGDGRPVHRFVHAGWIHDLAVTLDGRHLLAAGISNGFGGAALAVLDAAAPDGASPAAGGALPACANCPAGAPIAYFVAPWSHLAEPSDTPNVVVQVHHDGSIEWHANQRREQAGKAPGVIVTLSPSLELVGRGTNDYFAELHTALDPTGTRAGSKWDWRRPPVREWTPARGRREPRPE